MLPPLSLVSFSIPTITMDILTILIGVFLYAGLVYWLRPKRTLARPPGPKGSWFVGNTFQIPATFEWEAYQRWSKECGSDIIQLDIAGSSVVVLNKAQAAVDLLEKRSSLYSSRTRGPMLMELSGFGFNFAQMPYGDFWRAHRRMFHQVFHKTLGESWYKPQQVEAARMLIGKLSTTPTEFIQHIRFVGASLAISVGYGLKVGGPEHHLLKIAHDGARGLATVGTPGKYLVDFLPILAYVPAWMPGAAFRLEADSISKAAQLFVDVPFETAKTVFSTGAYQNSLVTSALSRVDPSYNVKQQELIIKNAAGTMFLGGVDTTASSLISFVLAMLARPDAQERAQKETDEVVLPGSNVGFEHEPALSYVTAIVKEVIRWKPVTPVGVPHYTEVDDVYQGYHISKRSLVIANQWAMLHDERVYSDPEMFNPDRFIKDNAIDESVMDPMTVAFGFGRRICPGRHMAYSSLWIFIASMLQAFTIEKAVDPDGNAIEPSYEIRPGFICCPLDFQCKISPRQNLH